MHPVLRQYQLRVDEVAGTMVRLVFSLPAQRKALCDFASKIGANLDDTVTAVTFGQAEAPAVHVETFRNQIDALADGGHDEVLIGNVTTAYIYALWEDKYRGAFANARGLCKDEIKSKFFGELGTYRHAIIHNQSIGTSKTASLAILQAFPAGAPVTVDRHVFEAILCNVRSELQAISNCASAG